MGPKIDQLTFRPDLEPQHLADLVDRIRPGLPAELWDVIQPYTLVPRARHAQTHGLSEPMDQTTGPWVCEISAPIKWWEAIEHAPVRIINTRPTPSELRRAWAMLTAHHLTPSIAVNLGRSPSGDWLLEVVAVVATGSIDPATAVEVADVLGGELVGIIQNPDSVLWRTSK